MTSKGGAAGSASERVLSWARRGRKRTTCPSEQSGWSISFEFCFELEGNGGTCLLCKNLRLRAFRRVESVLSKSLIISKTKRVPTKPERPAQHQSQQTCKQLDGGCQGVNFDSSLRADVVHPLVRKDPWYVGLGALQQVKQQYGSTV